MDIEELENRISDLENAYSEVEEAINSYPQVSRGNSDVSLLEQILDGIQYFINELNWQKEQLELEMEKEWDNDNRDF